MDITDYGYRYVGVRDLGERGNFVRAYQYIMPFTRCGPARTDTRDRMPSRLSPAICGCRWTITNCMIYNWVYSFGPEPITEAEFEEIERGYGRGPDDMLPNYRSKGNRENDWLIDRQVQKYETFTGINGINAQDVAVQESMGAIVDRSRENLTRSDMAIIQARRLLLQAAQTVSDGGVPPGVAPTYYNARAIEGILPKGTDWKPEMMGLMHPSPGE